MSTHTLIPVLVLAGTCLAAAARAQDTETRPLRVLIDRNLDRQLIELVSINDTLINYVDAAGKHVSAPVRDFVALAPIDAWDNTETTKSLFSRGSMISRSGVLELVDG